MKRWRNLEISLTVEPNVLPAKLNFPVYPRSSLLINLMLFFYLIDMFFCVPFYSNDQSLFYIVCIEVSIPSQKLPPPPLSCQAPHLKSINCPSPLFTQSPPLYWFFVNPSPKSRIFQWTLKILKVFILNTILSFKSNEK